MNVFIETMCSDLDTGPYLKGQGHMRQLKVRVYMLMSAYVLMEYHTTWYKCFPIWDVV